MIDGIKSNERIEGVLKAIGLPWMYMLFKGKTYFDEEGNEQEVKPPFVVYYGSGQNKQSADDTHYWSENSYNIEYYFTEKSIQAEEAIETAILDGGYQYEKSEDVYLEDEDLFAIYYYLN